MGDSIDGTREKTVTETNEIGDNAGEVAEAWISHMRLAIRTKTNNAIRQLSDNFLAPMERRTGKVIARLEDFRNAWREDVDQQMRGTRTR